MAWADDSVLTQARRGAEVFAMEVVVTVQSVPLAHAPRNFQRRGVLTHRELAYSEVT